MMGAHDIARTHDVTAYRDMHPGAYPPAGSRIPDAGSYWGARSALVPVPSDPDAPQRQREMADLAAGIMRRWRHRDLIASAIRCRRDLTDPETAAYLGEIICGRELADPEYRQRRGHEHRADSGEMDTWPIVRAAGVAWCDPRDTDTTCTGHGWPETVTP